MREKREGKKSDLAKPFLKWAGGKGQLLQEIRKYYPFSTDQNITRYAEPFVGGGAVLFDILNRYQLDEVYISDINAELINAYQIIRDDADGLIVKLKELQNQYLASNSADDRKQVYKSMRSRFNELKITQTLGIETAALMIALNKTCFNGLYRVNQKGEFNVPAGAYKSPLICDENNLRNVSSKLKNVQIICGDYSQSASFIDEHTFVYCDPPYRPLTKTASFNSYTEHLFNDEKQLELAYFVQEIQDKGAKIVVSNSDPKNVDEDDNFFDKAYEAQIIHRVSANRMINSKASARGRISELLISNF